MRTMLALLMIGLAGLPAHAVSDKQTQQRLNQFLTSAEKDGFRGAVLVARGGKILLERGYGVADPTRSTPIKSDTVFTTGSITKQFTAAAILVLEQEGKLSVTDPITRYFSEVPEDEIAISISSGAPKYSTCLAKTCS